MIVGGLYIMIGVDKRPRYENLQKKTKNITAILF